MLHIGWKRLRERRRENLRFPTDRLPTSPPPPPPLTPLMTRKRRLVKATGEFNQNLLLNRTKGAKRHKYVFLSPFPERFPIRSVSLFREFNIRYGPLAHTCFMPVSRYFTLWPFEFFSLILLWAFFNFFLLTPPSLSTLLHGPSMEILVWPLLAMH